MKRDHSHPQDLFKQTADLAKKTEQNRRDVINAEISTITSFCDRAETSMRLGNRDHARKILGEARKGVLTAKDQLVKLSTQGEDITCMKKALAGIEKRLHEIEKAA